MCHLPHSSADKDEDLKKNFDKNSNDESSMISRNFSEKRQTCTAAHQKTLAFVFSDVFLNLTSLERWKFCSFWIWFTWSRSCLTRSCNSESFSFSAISLYPSRSSPIWKREWISLHCYRDLTVPRCDSAVTYALVRNLELCQSSDILIRILVWIYL